MSMFSEYVLERIFADPEVRKCPVGTQSTIIHAIENILDELEVDINVPEPLHEQSLYADISESLSDSTSNASFSNW